MLLPIKPICKQSKIRRDGTSLIFIQYCHDSDNRTLLNTGIAIPPAYWKRSRIAADLPDSFGNANQLNYKVKHLLRVAEDIIAFAVQTKISNTIAFLKNTFHPDFDTAMLSKSDQAVAIKQAATNLDLYFQIDNYIESRKKKVSPKTTKTCEELKSYLQAFDLHRGEQSSFDTIDLGFFESFVGFLTYDYQLRRKKTAITGLRVNTIFKVVKQLRGFLLDRMNRKIIDRINLSGFTVQAEESDSIYLNWGKIACIYQTDLSQYPWLINSRDLFVLGCLTGLRFSDYSCIRPEDIRSGMIYKKQEKSDHWVVIPLRKEAKEILIERFNKVIPAVSNGDFNKHIKEIGRLAGLNESVKFSYKKGNGDIITVKPTYERITSHTCRRSFCTNEFLADTPVELIMKISGHKNIKDFYRYIRISPEEAGQKIKELWQKRGDINLLAAEERKVRTTIPNLQEV